jgi:hypothetical protein
LLATYGRLLLGGIFSLALISQSDCCCHHRYFETLHRLHPWRFPHHRCRARLSRCLCWPFSYFSSLHYFSIALMLFSSAEPGACSLFELFAIFSFCILLLYIVWNLVTRACFFVLVSALRYFVDAKASWIRLKSSFSIFFLLYHYKI